MPLADLPSTIWPIGHIHSDSNDMETYEQLQDVEEAPENPYFRKSRLEVAGLLHPDDMTPRRRRRTKGQDASGRRRAYKKEESKVSDLVALVRDKQLLMYGEECVPAFLPDQQQVQGLTTTLYHQPHRSLPPHHILPKGPAVNLPHQYGGQTSAWADQWSAGRPHSSSMYDASRGPDDTYNVGVGDIRGQPMHTRKHQPSVLDMASLIIPQGKCDSPIDTGQLVPGMNVLPRNHRSYFYPQLYSFEPPPPESVVDTRAYFSVDKRFNAQDSNVEFVDSSTSLEWLLASSQEATNQSYDHLHRYEYLDFGYEQLHANFTNNQKNNQTLTDFRNSVNSDECHRNTSNGCINPKSVPSHLNDQTAETNRPNVLDLHTSEHGSKHSWRSPSSILHPCAPRFLYDPRARGRGPGLPPVGLVLEGGGHALNSASTPRVTPRDESTSGDTHYQSRTNDPDTQETFYPYSGPRNKGNGQVLCDTQGYSVVDIYNTCLSPQLFTSQDSCDPRLPAVTHQRGSSQASAGVRHCSHTLPRIHSIDGNVDGLWYRAERPPLDQGCHYSHDNGHDGRSPAEPPPDEQLRFSPKISLTRTEDSYRSDAGGVVRVSTMEGEMVLDPRHWKLAHTFTGLLGHKTKLLSGSLLHPPHNDLGHASPLLTSHELLQLDTSP
ncbi:uncharacterized protein [Panulirus ornatus]